MPTRHVRLIPAWRHKPAVQVNLQYRFTGHQRRTAVFHMTRKTEGTEGASEDRSFEDRSFEDRSFVGNQPSSGIRGGRAARPRHQGRVARSWCLPHCGVAQLAEQAAVNRQAAGSSPAPTAYLFVQKLFIRTKPLPEEDPSYCEKDQAYRPAAQSRDPRAFVWWDPIYGAGRKWNSGSRGVRVRLSVRRRLSRGC